MSAATLALLIAVLGKAYVYCNIAQSIRLVRRIEGFTDFSLFSWFTAVPYLTLLMHTRSEIGLLTSSAFALAVGALLSASLHKIVFRRIDSPGALVLASICFSVITQNVLAITFGERVAYLPTADVLGFGQSGAGLRNLWVFMVSNALLFCVLLILLCASGIEVRSKAISCNRTLAEIVGLPIGRTMAVSRAVASIVMGIVGITVSVDVGITPWSGFELFLGAMIAETATRTASAWWLVPDSLCIVAAETLWSWFGGVALRDVGMFGLLLATLWFTTPPKSSRCHAEP